MGESQKPYAEWKKSIKIYTCCMISLIQNSRTDKAIYSGKKSEWLWPLGGEADSYWEGSGRNLLGGWDAFCIDRGLGCTFLYIYQNANVICKIWGLIVYKFYL